MLQSLTAVVLPLLLATLPSDADSTESELDAVWEWMQDETVVSVSKHAEDAIDAPASITVIHGEEIRAGRVANFMELFRRVPNTTYQYLTPYFGHLYLRGWPGNPKANAHVLVLLDWRQLNNESLGIPNWSALPVNASDIERIEIIHGPGSAVFGANAYSGVIHIITKKSRKPLEVRAEFGGGEFNRLRAEAQALGGHGDWSYRFSAGAERASSQSPYPRPDKEVVRTSGSLTWHRTHTEAITLDWAGALAAGTQIFPFGDVHVNHSRRIGGSLTWTQPHWTLRTYMAYGATLDSQMDLDVYTFFPASTAGIDNLGQYKANSTGREDFLGEVLTGLAVSDSYLNWDSELIYNHEQFFGGHFTGGLNLRLTTLDRDDTFANIPTSVRVGLFAQEQYKLGNNWLVTLGARADVNSANANANMLNPRLNVQYTLPGGGRLRMAYIQAFRKPSVFETHYKLFSERSDNPFVTQTDRLVPADSLENNVTRVQRVLNQAPGNEELLTEKVFGFEMGYRDRFWGDKLRIEIDSYYYFHRDMIGRPPRGQAYDTSMCDDLVSAAEKSACEQVQGLLWTNVPTGADALGMTISAEAHLNSEWNVWGNFAWREVFEVSKRWPWSEETHLEYRRWLEENDAEETTSYSYYLRREDMPHWQANAGVDYFGNQGLTMSVSGHGVGSIQEAPIRAARSSLMQIQKLTLSPIFLVNARVGYEFSLASITWEIAASAENLFDTQRLEWAGAIKDGVDADMYGNDPYSFDPPRPAITTPFGAEPHRRIIMGTLSGTW